jgi:hypothetical protein
MTSRPRLFIAAIAASAFAASLVLAGCGKSMSNRAAELAVQAASGGKVQISKSGQQTTIKTDQGIVTASSGSHVALPTDFPTDVHLPSAAYTISNVVQMGPTVIITLHTSSSLNTLYAEYDTTMKSAGWKEAMAVQSSQSESMLNFQKDNRVVTVTLAAKTGSSDGGTDVSVQHMVEKPGG